MNPYDPPDPIDETPDDPDKDRVVPPIEKNGVKLLIVSWVLIGCIIAYSYLTIGF
jgi:hypothetical protein